ncbi:MAG: folylpolyglutamate synthase/dihydrofolate synthase family protein [Ekhidna sp.]
MTYQETLEYLFARLPMYQRVGKVAYKKDLTNTLRLLDFLKEPHTKFKSVHIAGTNGKGTSAHCIAAALQSSGYKVGLYTSPHLKSFTERIRINGNEVSESFVVDFVDRIGPIIEEIAPSFFEITVAMAFDFFAKEKVDIAIIETGLGGRLDSTNVITPEVSLITNIGFDHMEMLGETLPEIAKEKAGIIKQGVPVVIGEVDEKSTFPVFKEVATALNAPLIVSKETSWKPNRLAPNYLVKNLPGILTVLEELTRQGWEIGEHQMYAAIDQVNELTGLKGRFQILGENPLVIADVSHNEDGLKVLFDQAKDLNQGMMHLIFGSVKEKSLAPIFKLIPPNTKIHWTQSSVPRALPVEELAIQGVMSGLEGECFHEVKDALIQAKGRAKQEDLILITGSTFVVAEVEEL